MVRFSENNHTRHNYEVFGKKLSRFELTAQRALDSLHYAFFYDSMC